MVDQFIKITPNNMDMVFRELKSLLGGKTLVRYYEYPDAIENNRVNGTSLVERSVEYRLYSIAELDVVLEKKFLRIRNPEYNNSFLIQEGDSYCVGDNRLTLLQTHYYNNCIHHIRIES